MRSCLLLSMELLVVYLSKDGWCSAAQSFHSRVLAYNIRSSSRVLRWITRNHPTLLGLINYTFTRLKQHRSSMEIHVRLAFVLGSDEAFCTHHHRWKYMLVANAPSYDGAATCKGPFHQPYSTSRCMYLYQGNLRYISKVPHVAATDRVNLDMTANILTVFANAALAHHHCLLCHRRLQS